MTTEGTALSIAAVNSLRNTYGDKFLSDILHKNDSGIPYDEIANYIEETQLSRRRRKELEMER